jgi:hypothetical protein
VPARTLTSVGARTSTLPIYNQPFAGHGFVTMIMAAECLTIEREVETGIFVPGKAMVDLERAGFTRLKTDWDHL